MSAIPKYILKRMIPEDAVKNTDFGWSIAITNVISPLAITEAPENVNDLFKITVDGQLVDNDRFSVVYDGREATVKNPKAAVGVTVPVGGVIELRCNGDKLSPGKHAFKMEILARSDMSIEFDRVVG
ncbi:MAG: hypothetical protein JW839_16785 [Candidatus Lokiarchaeota archaeon]|nr:hypothetical protein [Candidatus Lokiarchaeota archaeon]